MDKPALLERGRLVLSAFCQANDLPTPAIHEAERGKWPWGQCAFYRAGRVAICVSRCAPIGTAGRQWSYPGYTVDRTPYGVLQHELGHHVDLMRGVRKSAYWSEFSAAVRGQAGEKPITSYCPNDAEWFAEMFRVYVTNPDLLRLVRPRTHRELSTTFKPVFTDTWRERLRDAPARTITAAERHIEAAA
jgi:hypothetical protein